MREGGGRWIYRGVQADKRTLGHPALVARANAPGGRFAFLSQMESESSEKCGIGRHLAVRLPPFNEPRLLPILGNIVTPGNSFVERGRSTQPLGEGYGKVNLACFSDVVRGLPGPVQAGNTRMPSSRAFASRFLSCRSRCFASSTAVLSRR